MGCQRHGDAGGFHPDRPGPRVATLTDRQLQLMVACCAAVLLAACLVLGPDARGLGTHSRLGLPGCAYLLRTGVPCPACGATTSLCWFVRGGPGLSWQVHPAGLALGCVLLVSMPLSLLSALLGWRWLAHLRRLPLTAWTALVCAALALLLVGWPQRVRRYADAQHASGLHSTALRVSASRADAGR